MTDNIKWSFPAVDGAATEVAKRMAAEYTDGVDINIARDEDGGMEKFLRDMIYTTFLAGWMSHDEIISKNGE